MLQKSVSTDPGEAEEVRGIKRRSSLVAVLALMVVVALLALAGCGGDSSSDGVKSYTDGTYHCTFEYPSGWELQQGGTADVSAGGDAAASVGVYDPKGAVAEETYIDMVQVSVYELNVTVDESLMPEIKTEVEAVLASLESQAGDLKTVEPLAEASLGDMYGYKITYSFAKNNAPVTSTLYFMFFGDKEYQITVQAADENWEANQGIFNALLTSFKPEATD